MPILFILQMPEINGLRVYETSYPNMLAIKSELYIQYVFM